MLFNTYAAVVSVLLGAASANPWYSNTTTTTEHDTVTVTTEIVDVLVTYCPHPTTIVQNYKTYVVTEPTYLTIHDCPCTLTKTITLPAPTKNVAPPPPPASSHPPASTEGVTKYVTVTVTEALKTVTVHDCQSTTTQKASQAVIPPPVVVPYIYTTETVDYLVTYCPYPTTFVQNYKTYVVEKPTTLTITDCPCTTVKTIKSATTITNPVTKETDTKWTKPTSEPTHTWTTKTYSNGTAH